MGKDHIWDSTLRDRETTIEFNTVGTGKPDSKTIYGQRPYMGFNTAGQGNQTQRPYMGKDHIWDSTQQDRETRPKDHRIQHSWDRKTRSKNHIWTKTIYGIQHSGTGKPDSKTIYGQRPYMGFNTARQGNQIQRPYMGKDHIWDSTQLGQGNQTQRPYYGQRPYMGFNTAGQGNDHRIQHSWDRKTRLKNHIWTKTIYGIQHSGTGKPDSKTIYGQRPYMGFNTARQGNQTQRPYMGFNTVGTGKPDSKTILWAKTIYGIQHCGTGKRP